MKSLLNIAILCLSLAAGAAALEIAGTVPEAVKGAPKADFNLSGLVVKSVAYEKGAVIMPATENKGRTYNDVKLLAKGLYGRIETCFRSGCAKPAAKSAAPAIKVEGFKPLKSPVRVANAEISFDKELLVVAGVMASRKEPGEFWIAFPEALEFKDEAFKASVENAVKAAWAKNKK
ncbi:MAG: hypothetical protein NTY45_13730 [Elusimicrobia bacterium]|nr:hypothetical protein [Elusimicrobiota bacterium]